MRDSYDMIALNGEIDALDNKIPGALQLELYAAVQELLIDRMVWFMRNVDLNQGLASIVEHYRSGIEEVSRALDEALAGRCGECARRPREGTDRGRRAGDAGAAHRQPARARRSRRTSCWSRDRTERSIADVARTYFAVVRYFRLERIANAARDITATDYFDRLALDRARDLLGRAARQLTAEMLAGGQSGAEAVDAWVAPSRERGRTHPHVGARDRRYRVDAVEACGGSESAGAIWRGSDFRFSPVLRERQDQGLAVRRLRCPSLR